MENDRLNYAGRYFSFEDVEVLPKPIQKPHPPIWVAASSEPAIEWAAQRGLSIMMDPHRRTVEIARKRELYRAQLEAAGHRMDGREIPMARLIAVAETEAKAEEVARSGAGWIVGSYIGKSGGTFFDPKGAAEGPDRTLPRRRRRLRHAGEGGRRSPAARRGDVPRLPARAPLSHESFLLFTEKVLPKLV